MAIKDIAMYPAFLYTHKIQLVYVPNVKNPPYVYDIYVITKAINFSRLHVN